MTRTGALLLDLDGTLANSHPLLRAVYATFLAERGRRPSDEEFAELDGLPLRRVVEELVERHGLEGDPADHLREYRARILADYAEAPAYEDASALLERATDAGRRVVVVTSAPGDVARRWVEARGFAPRVHGLVGGDDVVDGKPAPEPYLAALRLAGVAGDAATAVEDSPTGARSAIAAGVRTLGLVRPPRDTCRWPAVAGFVRSLDEVLSEVEPCSR